MIQEQWYWIAEFPDLGNDPVAALIEEMSSENLETRWKAAWALGHFNDKRAVEPLIEGLQYSDPTCEASDCEDLNNISAWALGRIKDARAVEPLIQALSHEKFHLRTISAWALAEIGDKRAIEPLKEALKTDEFEVAWEASMSYAEGDDNPAVWRIGCFIDNYIIYPDNVSPIIKALLKLGVNQEEIDQIINQTNGKN